MNLTTIGTLSAHEIYTLVDGPHIEPDHILDASAVYLRYARDDIAATIAAAIKTDGIEALECIDSEHVDSIGDNFVSNDPRQAWQVFMNLRLIGLQDWDWDEVEDGLDIASVTFSALMRALFFRFNALLLDAVLGEVAEAGLDTATRL